MKHILFFTLILLFSINCFSKQRTPKKKKEKQLTYQEYIDKYGDNKTSVTIINIFFEKRDNSGIGKMSFLPLCASVTVVAPPVGAGLMVASFPLFISGLITRSNYSHKNLLKALQEYKTNQTLSKRLKKKVSRRHRVEEENYQMELEQARFASLKLIQ
jgi:hypothetical protein